MSSSMNNRPEDAYLDEPKAGRLNIQYAPAEGASVIENPPRFMWLPVVEDEAVYALKISKDASFPKASTHVFTDIQLNFLTPDIVLDEENYFWCYAVWDSTTQAPQTRWSQVREFTVEKDAVKVPLVGRTARYKKLATSHPRLWLNPDSLEAFSQNLANDSDHCSWETFFEKSVKPWTERPVMEEPKPYPNNTRVAPIWRQTYIDCQELVYAIRHLAVAGHVLKDQSMLDQAKAWLLSSAEWDPEGPTSRAYTDEWAFRVAVALAWGYDWLHGELTQEERDLVRASLLARTRQVADHVISHANIHLFPYDSHAVRSVSAVLVPACIAMWDEEPEAREWLDYSVEFLSTVYTPWGDAQGGWAEGPHYWIPGMAYQTDISILEAVSLV